MKNSSFAEALKSILLDDPRYAEGAYHFIREALDHTIRSLDKPQDGPGRHVSGKELLDGIRDYAIGEFGPLTLLVLDEWGIRESIDFGNLVFNLVEKGVLGKTDQDRVEDFANGYDFQDAFVKPFEPEPDTESATSAG